MKNRADEYKESTEQLLTLVASLAPEDLDKQDHEGWTPRQVIHHLADSESQSYSRLRRLLAEPGTMIQGYDEGKWADNATLGYTTEPIESAVAVIKAVRQASYELILRLTPDLLKNEGVHSESGAYSIDKWLSTYTRHTGDHANQIREQLGK